MWLNAHYEDRGQFDQDVKRVCETYEQAQGLREEGVNTISTDEKTGCPSGWNMNTYDTARRR